MNACNSLDDLFLQILNANRLRPGPEGAQPASRRRRMTPLLAMVPILFAAGHAGMAQQPPSPVTVFSPSSGATGVPLNFSLSWSAPSTATAYDLYFGTSPSPPFFAYT